MGSVPFLDELAVVIALAVAVTVVLARLQLPTVAGLLAAGALLGPHGMHLVTSEKAIESLAEVGVVLLLFTIGLEFSLERLRHIMRQVALGGALQVGITLAVTVGAVMALGGTWQRAVFYGCIFALSSTAIVLRALTDRRELDAPHGRFIVGTLIFQDLCVVPMVLVVPLLGETSGGGNPAVAIGLALLKAAAVVTTTVLIARFLVPRVLSWVDASRSREVFLLAILSLCIGTAWLTSLVGLSLALGAFLGGMVVAGTEYSHRAMGDVLPLRDVFVSLFFVSLGMLFDIRVVMTSPWLVLGLFLAFLLLKGLLATIAAMAMRFPARVAWLSGVGLAQFGEFGFVLANLGVAAGVVTSEAIAPVLSAGIASMFVTPLLVRIAPHVKAGEKLLAPLERLIGVRAIDEMKEIPEQHLSNHVVVVGYGIAGQFATRALAKAGLPYIVLELNADNVRKGKASDEPVYYGDGTSVEALGHAGLTAARLMVVMINDPTAAQRVVSTSKRVAPKVPVLVRMHYWRERDALIKAGADDVMAEEVEGAVEMIARMMRHLDVARNVIERSIQTVRNEMQSSERKITLKRSTLGEVRALDDLKIESILVHEQSAGVGKTIASLQIRKKTGATVVAIRREAKLLEHIEPTELLQAGDTVYLVGSSDALRAVSGLFDPVVSTGAAKR